MGKYIIDENTLTAIADSIRDRTGVTGDVEPEQMIIDISALGPLKNTVPAYVETEAARVVALAKASMNSNTIAFLAMSDTHVLSTNTTAMAGLNSAVQGARIIKETLPLDFTAVLGDVAFGAGDDTRELHQANLLASRRAMGVFNPDVVLEGNHDRGYNDAAWLAGGLLNRYVGRFNKNITIPSSNADRGYCYMDLTAKKTRVIFMNTSDLRDKDSSFHGDCYISADQYTWLVSTLTSVGANTGWNIIIVTHHPLHWAENMGNLATLLDKYNAGGSGSVTVDGTTVSYNFSGKNKAKLLCNIHGHTHNFITGRVGTSEIVRIGTPNAYFYRNNEYTGDFGESTTYNKTANSAKDTSFCIYVINPSELVCKAFCYGAGYDRTISLDEVLETYTVTNTLTKTTTNNSATTVTEKSSYTATLTANSGYELSSVKVTMGGTDVTSSVYSNGKITINSVTGNIVITAVSTVIAVSYTNLVPTAIDFDLVGVYNSIGYRNGYYVSTTAPYTTATSDGSCVTGLFEYDWLGPNRNGAIQPPTIYIKGVTFDTSNSHNRFGFFRDDTKVVYTTQTVANLATYFTIETLGTQYYKLTPIMQNGKNMFYVKYSENAFSVYITHFAISANGNGANMIVTFNEPIV